MQLYAAGPRLKRAFGEIVVIDDDGSQSPYVMLVGLQRMIYSWISPNSKEGVDLAVPYLRSIIAALLALTFTAFIAVVTIEFGYLCAAITALMLALSNWLVVFGPDLFWICADFFVPFVLGWLLGDPSRPIKQRRLLAIFFTFSCLLKCLCGFDYITNIFAAVAVPFIYYGLRRGTPLRQIAMRILRYGALSVAAFGAAIVLQIMQFHFVQKETSHSVAFFFNEARMRIASNGEGISNRYDNAVLSVLHKLHFAARHDVLAEHFLIPLRPVLRYFRYLSMGATTVPLPIHSLVIPVGFFVVGFPIALWLYRKRYREDASAKTDCVTAWMWATLAALLISHFWVVAANGHMTHTFFNAIVFYIPFLPMVYVAIGISITTLVSKLKQQTIAS
jgi:hypothetical protein